MKSTPIFNVGRPLLAIGYKYNSRKILGLIATEGGGITELGDPYLSRFPDIFSNVSVCPVFCSCFLVIYLNAFNAIDNHNRMRKSDLLLEKYWLTQSGYLDLQLQWYWVWVLQMGSSYTAMVFHREMWTGKFQPWSKTTGRFITASIMPLYMDLVAQL